MPAATTPLASAPSVRPVNEGSAFAPESGKLYRFEAGAHPVIEVMRLWPDPRAWRRYAGGGWRGHRPEIDLRPGPTRGRMRPLVRTWRRNLALAVERVPDDVVRVVAPLPVFLRWRALSLVARVEGALELFESNPALGAALAYPAAFGRPVQRPLRVARRLVARRRVHVLEWLGLPATRSAERVLRRLPAQDINCRSLELVGRLLREGSRVLHHMPRLHAPLLRILAEGSSRKQVSGALVRALADAPRSDIDRVARQIKWIGVIQDDLRVEVRPTLRTEPQVARLYASLWGRRRRESRFRWTIESFPPPPFPVAALERFRLVPSTRPQELAQLGAVLDNCLGGVPSYPHGVAAGHSYVYSVQDPLVGRPLAALHLHRKLDAGTPWEVLELLGPSNAPVAEATAVAVGAWLEEAQSVPGEWSVVHPSTITRREVPEASEASGAPEATPGD